MCPSCLQIRSLDEFILYMAGGLRKLVFVDICLSCLGKKKSGKSQPHGYCREMKIVMEQNNRAKRSGLVADLTLEQWLEFLENAQVCCTSCQKDVGREHLALDHIIPVRKGGGTTKSNLTPACKACNLSKGRGTLEEWERRQESMLDTLTHLVQQEYDRLQQEGGKHHAAHEKDQA